MREHYQTELNQLRARITQLGRTVIDNVKQATDALLEADTDKARTVLHNEHSVDFTEVRVEEECLKIIALHQPVADDLRFLVSVFKVNHELERISDLAAGLAKRVREDANGAVEPYRGDMLAMSVLALDMLSDGLRSLLERDVEAAKRIWQSDSAVDELCTRLTVRLRADIRAQGGDGEVRFDFLEAVADIERMADHAANIAKTVIYEILGQIVRHRGREFRVRAAGDRVRVLFVCVHNSARSVMAAAWLNHLYGAKYAAESAGLMPGETNPLAVRAMEEAGIDVSGHTPRDVFTLAQSGAEFDYVVTVCDAASAERCPPVLGIAEQIQWEFDDPATFAGSEDERLAGTRRVRNAIRTQIEEWAGAVSR